MAFASERFSLQTSVSFLQKDTERTIPVSRGAKDSEEGAEASYREAPVTSSDVCPPPPTGRHPAPKRDAGWVVGGWIVGPGRSRDILPQDNGV